MNCLSKNNLKPDSYPSPLGTYPLGLILSLIKMDCNPVCSLPIQSFQIRLESQVENGDRIEQSEMKRKVIAGVSCYTYYQVIRL